MWINVKYLTSFLALFVAIGLTGQSLNITGTVSDEDGITLPGANVLIKGTGTGVNTDFDGKFTLAADTGDVLLISYIGYNSTEITVGDQMEIFVVLSASSLTLDEVVVVGYGTQKKVTNTGAITSVTSEDLLKSPAASVANSLAGKVTGLSTIQFSGQPGADDPSIYVRGVASLFEDRSQPLMIVDGVQRSFMQLDPNEIESVSVLKDASATAVFGVRGANGVIIVTTKRGKEGKARISANLSSGLQIPTVLLDFADSYTYANMYNEAQLNDNPSLAEDQLKFSPRALEAFQSGSDPLIYPNTDWLDYMLKPSALQQNANVNISGGTKKVNYFVSVGFLNQDGLFNTFNSQYDNNFSYQRYNYRTNLDINLTRTTKIGITTGGRVATRNQPRDYDNEFFRQIYWSVPFSGPGLVDGKYLKSSIFYISDEKKDGLTNVYDRGYNNRTNNVLNFDIDLDQKLDFILKGLKFRSKFSYNSSYFHTKTLATTPAIYEPYYQRDLDPSIDPEDVSIVYKKINTGGNKTYSEGKGKDRNYYMEAGLEYDRKFGKHAFGGLLLYNQNKDYYPSQWSYIPTGLVGVVGRLTYNYNVRYLLDLNLGYNGSENFAEENRFGFFPAVSLGWVLSEENFFPTSDFFNYAKMRISYGIVGNDRIGNNRFLYLPDNYNPDTYGYNFGTNVPTNQSGAAEGMIGNPDVTWETARKQNYGIDTRFIQDRLGFTFDYFMENRNDILTFRQTVPGYLAIDLPAVNIGEVENKGYEMELSWRQTISKDFRYWFNVNMSHARNKIIFMDEVPQPYDYLYRTGHPVNQNFGYVFDRFFGENEDISSIPDHQYELKAGDMVYKDLNGDGVINQNDQQAIGYTVYPENTYGANLGLTYKGFSLAMFWAAATHTSRLLDETFRIAFGNTLNRSLLQYMADGRWTPETASTASYPRMTLTGSLNNSKDSDFWLRDASYLRLKNVELGYEFSGEALKNRGLRSLRAYINAYNLLTFDKLEITDPESKTGKTPAYPLVKVVNLGIKLTF